MKSAILKTKLIFPVLQSRLVPRPRLINKFDAAIKNGLGFTLIAAPAGFGKTTAISSWVHQFKHRAAWVSLDENDNEPIVFWSCVIAALQTIMPDFCAAILDDLEAAPSPVTDSFLPIVVNELVELAHPVILVLDDYHVISNPEIHDGLAFLLNHLPPRLHLVIATRADPPLPVARLRAQQALNEVRVNDLRFTLEEAQILLNGIMGLGLDAEEINLLEARTEGWGVGLVLAAQSMQDRVDKHEFISAFSGSHHYILEYLMDEVLSRQPESRRDFLLRTSILDQLCGSLCDEVSGQKNSVEMLSQLHKDNLFIIPLDLDRTWYRYHHLFGDLLVSYLHKEVSQVEIQNLYLRASLWYQEEGNLERAVQYALKGQDFERAADLIEFEAGRIIARGQVKTLLQWIRALPENVVKNRSVLLMRLGWTVFLSGNVSEASRVLFEARETLNSIQDEMKRDLLEGQLFAMLATLTALTRDLPGAIAQAEQALKKLPAGETIYRARAMRAMGVCHMFLGNMDKALEILEQGKSLALDGENKFLGSEIISQIATVRKHQGQLNKAFAAYHEILGLYDNPEAAPSACLGYAGMAEMALEGNDLKTAQKYLNAAIELCQKGSIGYILQPAYLILGLLKQAMGDELGALEAMRQGENLSRKGGGSLQGILGLAGHQVRFNLQVGKIATAEQWALGKLLPSDWSFDSLPLILYEFQQSLLARVSMVKGEFEKVIKIHDSLFERAQAGGRMARIIELSLFKAAALQGLGRGGEALVTFERCLALAEPQGYFRLFLESGAQIRSLLQQTAASGPQKNFAKNILDTLSVSQGLPARQAVGRSPDTQLVERLTVRELEVLRLICEGRSNRQIAEVMYVSENTIKKHTSNIYGKLGVTNRAQAVIRAREIEII